MTGLGTHVLAAVAAGTLALAVAHCAPGRQEGETQAETGSATAELISKSFEDVQQALGKPIEEDRFELGVAVPEFRIELNNFFDAARRADDPPDIREATWSLSPDENLTIWFTQPEAEEAWRAIHFLSWHPDDEF